MALVLANGTRPARSSPSSTPTSTNVFNWGEYSVDTTIVEKSGLLSCLGCCKPIFSFLGCCTQTLFSCLGLCECNCLPNCYGDHKQDNKLPPPKEVLIVHPIKSGTYPVLLFFHGTSLVNSFYSHLFKHIASHGFIVVAPQLYELPPAASVELNAAESVMDWLIDGLQGHLPTGVQPDFGSGLALAGHSRGGRTAFALANKLAAESIKNEAGNIQTRLITRSGKDVNLSVLIGVDPVAASTSGATMPEVDPDTNYFKFDVPAVVIGSGLGGSCAPESGNYKQFFKRCKPPKRAEFLATEYGHMDVLDDNPTGHTSFSRISALLAKCMCQNAEGRSRLCMSRTAGGISVAFFTAYNNKSPDPTDLNAIENDPGLAPAQLVIPDPEAARLSSLGFW